jgi:hypothetical protein
MDGVLIMPANKYGKSLYKAGTIKSEKAAIANRDPARKEAAKEITKREGTTSPAGGRPAPARERNSVREIAAKMPARERNSVREIAAKMPAKVVMPKAPKAPQVIRTTTMMKPTPTRDRNSIRETRKK